MTLSFRPRPFARLLTKFAPVALAVAVAGLAATGCEDKHIGRVCSLATNDDGGSTSTGANFSINPQAVECPSRICVLPAGDKQTETGPLCTADCSSDDDCSDGETVAASDFKNPRCKTGFACMVPTTVGDFCCRKLCVCKDFFEVPAEGFRTPASCAPGQSACKNVR